MRERIYRVIEKSDGKDRLSRAYDLGMIFVIVMSLLPLGFKFESPFLRGIDKVCLFIFIADYLLRVMTADFCYGKKWTSFFRYPLSFMGVIDLLSILPSLTFLNSSFKLLRMIRMMRAMRVIRVFKVMRYSKSVVILSAVFRETRDSLVAVGVLAVGYILVSALIVFNVEPDSFPSFFEAVYWATVSLTTVGYGDLYPVTTLGRVVAMISSLFGIAVVALPAGIITAGYMNKLHGEPDVRCDRRAEAHSCEREEEPQRP